VAAVTLDRVVKRFGAVVAIDDVSLAVVVGDFHAVVGAWGGG
jgi:ABC-type uncharacterized transport system ATPase subunit